MKPVACFLVAVFAVAPVVSLALASDEVAALVAVLSVVAAAVLAAWVWSAPAPRARRFRQEGKCGGRSGCCLPWQCRVAGQSSSGQEPRSGLKPAALFVAAAVLMVLGFVFFDYEAGGVYRLDRIARFLGDIYPGVIAGLIGAGLVKLFDR